MLCLADLCWMDLDAYARLFLEMMTPFIMFTLLACVFIVHRTAHALEERLYAWGVLKKSAEHLQREAELKIFNEKMDEIDKEFEASIARDNQMAISNRKRAKRIRRHHKRYHEQLRILEAERPPDESFSLKACKYGSLWRARESCADLMCLAMTQLDGRTAISIYLFTYVELALACLSIYDCREIDGVEYVIAHPSMQCNDERCVELNASAKLSVVANAVCAI